MVGHYRKNRRGDVCPSVIQADFGDTTEVSRHTEMEEKKDRRYSTGVFEAHKYVVLKMWLIES